MKIALIPAPRGAAEVLDRLVTGLIEPGESLAIDNTGGAFMAVHVSYLVKNEHGQIYSIAHRYEAQGDLVADPDIEVLRNESDWFPLSITTADGRKEAVRFGDDGRVDVDQREYPDQLQFLVFWTRNIREQQGL